MPLIFCAVAVLLRCFLSSLFVSIYRPRSLSLENRFHIVSLYTREINYYYFCNNGNILIIIVRV